MRGDFGEVRSLLNCEPSRERWERLCELLDAFAPEELDAMIFPYIDGHLRLWPHELCKAPKEWVWRALQDEHLPFWHIVRCMDLSGAYLKAPDMLTLLKSPHLLRITILEMDSNRIGLEGVEALAQSESLGEIEVLNLGFNAMGSQGLRALMGSAALSNLRRLNLESNALRDRHALPSLAKAPWLQTLQSLSLTRNALKLKELTKLLSKLHAPSLRHLCLDRNPLGSLKPLLEAHEQGQLPALVHLEVRGCNLKEPACRALLGSSLMGQLEQLDISYNEGVVDEALLVMLDAGTGGRLERLWLEATAARAPLMERLLRELPSLTHLCCAASSMGTPEVRRWGARNFTAQQSASLGRLRLIAPHVEVVMGK